MDPFPSTRETLLVRLRDPKNSQAWEEFMRSYEPLVYGLVRKRGLQDADARDLCQDVFRSVARAIGRFEGQEPGSFRKWLLKIAKNNLLNQLNRRNRPGWENGGSALQRALASHPDPSSESVTEDETEFRRHLFRFAATAIRSEFTSNTWQAFWRTAVDSQPVIAVATELKLSVGAVYIARSRVLARLREQVRELEGQGESHG